MCSNLNLGPRVRGQSSKVMGKLNAALLRYLTKDEFRVLTAVSSNPC